MQNKITYHYSNGKTYTVKGAEIIEIFWGEFLGIMVPQLGNKITELELPEDTIAVTYQDKEGNIYMYRNPAFELSVNIDIKTNRQRKKIKNKENNLNIVIDKKINIADKFIEALKEVQGVGSKFN